MNPVNVEKTSALIHQALQHTPFWASDIKNIINCRIEHYICSIGKLEVPPTPYPVVVVHYSGKKVSQLTTNTADVARPSSEVISFPSITTIMPGQENTSWQFQGDIDLVTIIFDGPAMKKLLNSLNSRHQPITLTDTLIGSLLRQLINVIAENNAGQKQNFTDDDNHQNDHCHDKQEYIDALSNALLLQICHQLTSSTVHDNVNTTSTRFHYVQESISFIQHNLSKAITAKEISAHVGLHQSYFRYIFQQVTGFSLHQYVMQARLDLAKEQLINTPISIAEIASQTGFSSQSHMAKNFKDRFDVTPTMFRKDKK